MQLNGWQRLFCLVFALLASALFALWLVGRPTDGFTTIYSCNSPSFVTQAEAIGHLDRNDYAERDYATRSDCRIALEKIASGETLKTAQDRWWSSLRTGAIAFAIFAFVVYVIGVGIGWVWRGFRPASRDRIKDADSK